eukprot:tig00021464_g21755.t1
MADAEEAHDASFLALVVDMNPFVWSREPATDAPGAALDLGRFLEHLIVFVRCFGLLHRENQLTVTTTTSNRASHVPSPIGRGHAANVDVSKRLLSDLALAARPRQVDAAQSDGLASRTSDSFTAPVHESTSAGSNVAAAMSMALCYCNRIAKEQPSLNPRLLVISVSLDVPAQYIAFMNAIFCAQKNGVPIDSCVLAPRDSVFLQQASHITGGYYSRLGSQAVLLQHLLGTSILDRFSRRFAQSAFQHTVDFRSTCFCHRKIVDLGFVCSVCLSIFCTFSPICSTCGTKFSIALRPPKK